MNNIGRFFVCHELIIMIQGTADRVRINNKFFVNKINFVTHLLFIAL
jgi:hypothetical protein